MTGLEFFGLSKNWVMYLASGAAVLAASSLSGCRFGNKVEFQQTPDTFEHYETEPKTVEYCVTLSNLPLSEADVCREAELELLPPLVGSIMSNPVTLKIVGGRLDGLAYFLHNARTPKAAEFPIFLETDKTFSVQASRDAERLWSSTDCALQDVFTTKGALVSGAKRTVTNSLGEPVEVLGRVSAQFVIYENFVNSCTTALGEISSCYTAAENCPGDSTEEQQDIHQGVRGFFAPYVESGALRPSDIPYLVRRFYKVSYE
jgi:hypothetical protein